MDNGDNRIGVLKAVLEDIASELAAVCEKEFVVGEDDITVSGSKEDFGRCTVIYEGINSDARASERKSVLFVSQGLFQAKAKNEKYIQVCFEMPPSQFIIEYLLEYASQFGAKYLARYKTY